MPRVMIGVELQEMNKRIKELGLEVDKINASLKNVNMEKLQKNSKDPWKRYAIEGYVRSRLTANHKYTRDVALILEERIEKLEKQVATHRKIATLMCAIILIEKVFRLLVQHCKCRK
jgi:uncharacterized coiled-coil protein SlyX